MTTEYEVVVLGDVLRMALPLGSVVQVGQATSRRPVNWVVIVTRRDQLASQIEPGDLALIPPALQEEATRPELIEMLQQMASLTAAAAIFFQTIPTDVLQALEGYDLPLVEAPSETNLRAAHRQIATLLTDRQRQMSARGMQLYRQLSEMSREGHGLQKMADLVARLTGKLVVVQDKRLEVAALSIPPDGVVLDEALLLQAVQDPENLPAVLRNRKAAAKTNRSHWQQLLLPTYNLARLISPIISGDRARGYFSIIGAADALDSLDTVAVEQAAAACALEMAKAKAVSEAKKALRGDFLEGVLAGNIPPDEIERLAAHLDHDTSRPHAVLLARWVGGETPSLRRIETTLNWLLSSHNRPALVHIYAGDHVCVLQAVRDASDMEAVRDMGRRLREQLRADFPDRGLVISVSGLAQTLTEWPQVHRQALQALDVGERLRLDEVVDYNSLGVYRLLSQLDHIPLVHNYCSQVIGPLVRYDREHNSALVQTLDAYFEHHGNVSQTAEALFIHRNTLLYRLDRIQELTGHPLTQANMRLALHLALKLWQLRPDT